MRSTCKDCEAFMPDTGASGQCRRRSPVPQMIMTQGITGPVPQVIGMWPGVSQGDWCKEYTDGTLKKFGGIE